MPPTQCDPPPLNVTPPPPTQCDPTPTFQDILLRRAADALEMFYSFPRTHATPNINQLNPMFTYPHSPALFALTPQPFTPARLGGGGISMFPPPHKISNGFSMAEQPGGGGGGGYLAKVQKVEPMGLDDPALMIYHHRASTTEGHVPKSQSGMGHSIFEFPPVSGDMMGSDLHKTRQTGAFPIPPMYTFSVMQASYHDGDPSGGPVGMYMDGPAVTGSGDLGNRNNNNSTIESHTNSSGYMPRLLSNGTMPSSPGHFIPPSCKFAWPVTTYHNLMTGGA